MLRGVNHEASGKSRCMQPVNPSSADAQTVISHQTKCNRQATSTPSSLPAKSKGITQRFPILYLLVVSQVRLHAGPPRLPQGRPGDVEGYDQARHEEHRPPVVSCPVTVVALEHLEVGRRRGGGCTSAGGGCLGLLVKYAVCSNSKSRPEAPGRYVPTALMVRYSEQMRRRPQGAFAC